MGRFLGGRVKITPAVFPYSHGFLAGFMALLSHFEVFRVVF
jgi:hypothetical protein